MEDWNDGAVELPIDGVLDLHAFRPSDVKDLVPDYLEACAEKGIKYIRIIHGKGSGTLRAIVHARLAESDLVESFSLAGDGSGWGATVVVLKDEALHPG